MEYEQWKNFFMNKKTVISLLLIVGVYLISTGLSYALFSEKNTTKKQTPSAIKPKSDKDAITFDDTLPKTEACPLNGVMYSKKQKEWWETHRPLGIMIENHQDSRPQSGLSRADIIYEAVAEGAITRFLAVFHCQDAGIVGPVRSARTYFLDWVSEYGDSPLYVHVGGANTPGPADALSQIESYSWAAYNDLNQYSIGFPTFWRDYDRLGHTVATEHTMYSTTTKLWTFAANKRKLTNTDEEGNFWDKKFVSYTFKDDDSLSERPQTQLVHLEFWEDYNEYTVDWNYDGANNIYKRNNGGDSHLDKDNGKILTAKNVVVLFMEESRADDGYENNLHLLYRNKGKGKAIVIRDGKKINGTWKKDGRTARTLIFDETGTSVKFNRGTIWFEILPTEGIIEVK